MILPSRSSQIWPNSESFVIWIHQLIRQSNPLEDLKTNTENPRAHLRERSQTSWKGSFKLRLPILYFFFCNILSRKQWDYLALFVPIRHVLQGLIRFYEEFKYCKIGTFAKMLYCSFFRTVLTLMWCTEWKNSWIILHRLRIHFFGSWFIIKYIFDNFEPITTGGLLNSSILLWINFGQCFYRKQKINTHKKKNTIVKNSFNKIHYSQAHINEKLHMNVSFNMITYLKVFFNIWRLLDATITS